MFKNIIIDLTKNYHFYFDLVISHLQISLIAASISAIVGIFVGVVIAEKRKYAPLIINFVNIIYTIPAIALFGALILVTGIGNLTAIIALAIYGLLPVVKNTYTAIVNIDPKTIEAAKAMGSSETQILFKIKLPLAFPLIFTAVSNMITMTTALTGIASFVGAGGLGVAIYRGITTNNQILIFNGSLLIALMAIFFDVSLNLLQTRIRKNGKKLSIILLTVLIFSSLFYLNKPKEDVIKIASKPTTESYILAEMMALVIEKNTDLKTRITHGVAGGTGNIHPALIKGEFDLYPEYTGTSWQIVLKNNEIYQNELFDKLNQSYKDKYHLSWVTMFGFNDTYSLGINTELAEKYQITSFSELANYSKDFIFGAEYDFFQREDGYQNLAKAYNLEFKKTVDMDNGLKYQALIDGKLDVMTVFTTDGQLSNPKIKVLKDDMNFYPSYMAGIVARNEILAEYPQLQKALSLLENVIDEKMMSELNHQVEVLNYKPKTVAEMFLKEKGIIK